MAKKKILLTGDDGYNSYGTRILIHALRDVFDLTVVGTATQQSAVGGKMSLATGFRWEQGEIEGIPAVIVHGTPVDGLELASDLFGHEGAFELVISGINWGVNLGTSLFSSGTANAAIRGLMTQLAPRAVAMSLDLQGDHWTKIHNQEDSIAEYLPYPGAAVLPLLQLFEQEKYWGAQLLNVNFPNTTTTKVKLVQLTFDSTKVYKHREMTGADKQGGQYLYASELVKNPGLSPENDIMALQAGWITVSPCQIDLTDRQAFAQHTGFQTDLKL